MKAALFIFLSLTGLAFAQICPPGPTCLPALDFLKASDDTKIDRLKAIHSLGDNLTSAEAAHCYQFLKSRPAPDEKNLPRLRLLKNDLLNVLRAQKTTPEGLTETLIEIFHDKEQDSVIRDYVIQHLAAWQEQGSAVDAGSTQQIQAVLKEAAQEGGSIAGTALLGLHRLSGVCSGEMSGKDDCSVLASKLAVSPGTDSAARITAIQVCAERGIKEPLPEIESLARNGTSLALRISAVAALGRLGGPEHAAFLQHLETGHNEALRTAAATALKRLHQKQQLFLGEPE